MATSKFTTGILGVIAVATSATSVYQFNALEKIRDELVRTQERHDALRNKMQDMQTELASSARRAAAAEEDNAKLLTAVESFRTTSAAHAIQTGAAPAIPITHDVVEARFKRAKEIALTDPETALEEFLWCFDEGMPRVTGFGGVRNSYLLSAIADLGQRHPPALEALRSRRDIAKERMLRSEKDYEATKDFSSINRVLKEDATTIAVYDQLPANDRRRTTLGGAAFELLVDHRRYADAIQARPAGQLRRGFDLISDMSGRTAMTEAQKRQHQEYVVRSTARNIEVLAGAGNLAEAKELAAKLLAFDDSESAKVVVQEHLARAGQPTLLHEPPATAAR